VDSEITTLRVVSDPLQGNDGIEAFRETFGRRILGIEIDPLGGLPIEIDLTLRVLPGFAMATGSLSPMHNRHTSALIDNDDVVLVVLQNGRGEVSQHGRTAMVNEGEAVLTANGTVATFSAPQPTRVINLRLSRQLLASHVANLDDLVARPIPKDDRVLRLLVGHAIMLNGQSELAMTELRNLIAGHMHALAALVLGPRDPGQHLQTMRATRLASIKSSIVAKIGAHGFTIADIARSQQISESYIRQLLAEAGTTFTDFVLGERLDRVRRMLVNPLYRNRGISAIAYDAGFGDVSYFNRTFRRRYGATPSDVREAAQGPTSPGRGDVK
jgi:AraC-like DNA-binding protein